MTSLHKLNGGIPTGLRDDPKDPALSNTQKRSPQPIRRKEIAALVNVKPVAEVSHFLKLPVPPWPSHEADTWKRDGLELGRRFPKQFMRALRQAPPNGQYAALLVLRFIGIEAWAEGYGAELRYKVKDEKGQTLTFKPHLIQNPEP